MKQTRLESLVETCVNVGIGFVLSSAAWPLVAELHGLPYTVSNALTITLFFTLLSVARG